MFNKIKDSRSFFGGLALLIAGTLIAVEGIFFFHKDYFGVGILRSRWWWEILLNFQILALASMWFAHHNRLVGTFGRARLRAFMNFARGFLITAIPGLLMPVAAYQGWFHTVPEKGDVTVLMDYIVLLWLLVVVFAALPRLLGRGRAAISLKAVWARYWAGALMVVCTGCGRWLGIDEGYIAGPFLGYLHGALPYFKKSFRSSPKYADD